jgi:predicted secreted protein
MGWVTGLAVYFILWWLVLFMVLPWGVRAIDREDVAKGHAASAPVRPRIALKMAVTTVIAGLFWLIVYLIIDRGLIALRA